MSYTVSLPFLDSDGTLTPKVVDALANGATSDRDPNDATKIVLTFSKKADAAAFRASLGNEPVSDVVDAGGDDQPEA